MKNYSMKNDIFGVKFDNMVLEEAVKIGYLLSEGEDFHYVVTPNPEIVAMTDTVEGYGDILNGAKMVLPDGIGIVYAGEIMGKPFRSRVPGIDFAAGLMEKMASEGGSLYLLGAKPGVAEAAAESLGEDYPGLTVCGTRDGYFSEEENEAVLAEIKASGATVVFVCLGAPKQEQWMASFGEKTGAKLMVGLGGCLDVWSGAVGRAPKAMQETGFEWLYRLAKQPSRIKRVAKLPVFLLAALLYRTKGH